MYNCRLSSDERTLQFDGHESDDAAEAIQGIDLGKVLSLQEGQCDGGCNLSLFTGKADVDRHDFCARQKCPS